MKTRERVFARDGGLCQCEDCQNSGHPKLAGEIDHRVPLHLGGADDDSNLQSINVDCHELKSKREAASRSGKYEGTQTSGEQKPLEFLMQVMNDNKADPALRVRAAVTVAQYMHTKRSDGGKKDEKDRAAKKAGAGKFAAAPPPRLIVNNG